MLGAIIGDVVGSIYEVYEIEERRKRDDKKRSYEDRIKILNPQEELFHSLSSYTDDTVLTVAIANSILNNIPYEISLREFGLNELTLGLDEYGRNRFGKGFVSWLKKEKDGDSYGNGASMRISAVGYYYNDIDTILEESKKATIPSHNNEEAIIGAQAVATSIFLARTTKSKEAIKEYLSETFDYQLDFNLEELQKTYTFSSRTISSVPQAIYCFLVSDNFEDCLRKSLSIGGDSDTIAAIACSIAEAFYSIPEELKERIPAYLPEKYRNIVDNFYKSIEEKDVKKKIYV